MRKTKNVLVILFLVLFFLPGYAFQTEEKAAKEPRPLEDIQDILAWKSIRTPVLSPDGQWFACRLAPAEGNGEVFIRQTKGDKEYRFPAGETVGFATGGEVAFSDDSRWLAFFILPDAKEAQKLKKQKKPLYNKVALINLSTGEKTEFEKAKSFSFSGENPSWIALHKYPPEGQEKEKEKPGGSDLILHELATSKQLNFGNVSEFAFDKRGRWLAWAVEAQDQSGNGIQLRNMATGVILPLDNDKTVYKRLTWTEEGDGLAVLKGKEDKDFEDKLFSLVGFYNFIASGPHKVAFDPKEDPSFPEGMTISPNRNPAWTDNFSGILFGIHEVKKKEKEEKAKEEQAQGRPEDEDKEKKEPPQKKPEDELDKEDLPDLVIWHWLDKRLQSMQQVQENMDKNFSFLSIFRIKEKKFIRLADNNLRNVIPAPKHLWAIGLDNSEYELEGNLDGQRYQDVYVVDLKTGARKLALKKCRWYFSPSPDGTHFLFYENSHYYTYEMATNKKYNITKDVPTSFINTENDHNVVDPPISPFYFGWAKDGVSVLLYDNWDVWNVPVQGGKGTNLTLNGKKDGIRYRSRFRLDPEEKGIDLTRPLYVEPYGEWTKKGGIALIERGKPGAKMLLWDDAVFSLMKAKKSDVYLYTKQTYKDYPDYYATGPLLNDGQKITEANPKQKEFLWSSGTMLVDYESAKGDKLQAALILPANYEKEKSYPTIVYIYEKLSQGLNRYLMPSARGFSAAIYTSRGYAVLMPDIVYKVNDPGMSSVWCVLPAIEAAINTGIVDRERIGIHGHSWGGYQSSFLVTQSDIFKACVTGAPLTNLISMYSSIYWNTGSANQPIFESSQGRFKGGYWENLEAYTRNSAVYYAQNVKTPLIILHNDKDGAVDWNQGIEYFNTLRRLGKPAVMLQYKGENHGLVKPANQKDYTIRMREFFDHYLLGKPAPEWVKEGILHLKHEEHLKQKTKEILKK